MGRGREENNLIRLDHFREAMEEITGQGAEVETAGVGVGMRRCHSLLNTYLLRISLPYESLPLRSTECGVIVNLVQGCWDSGNIGVSISRNRY